MLCHCGCGGDVGSRAKGSQLSRGPKIFLQGHNMRVQEIPPKQRIAMIATRHMNMPNRWGGDEIDILRRIYYSTEVKDVARLLGRTVRATYAKAFQLGMSLPANVRNAANAKKLTMINTGLRHPNWKGGPQESGMRQRRKRKPWMVTDRKDKGLYYRVLLRDRGICGICHKFVETPEEVSFDHIIPLSKGGGHNDGNLQVAHLICNSKKKDKLDYKPE